MITKDNFANLLATLGFAKNQQTYSMEFSSDIYLAVDFAKEQLIYPENKGFVINERQTCNFSSSENFVVFECVYQLLKKGYKPEHIELEPKWKVGHGASGGRADILVRNQENRPLLIIECKTAGREFEKAWKDTLVDGGQLFSYIEQEKSVEFICLYASDFDEKTKTLTTHQKIISHKDNSKILAEDTKLKSFKDAANVKERFKVWQNTYASEYTEKGIFEENIQAYQIGKDNYTLEIDTKPIDASDKKGKYHEFRTILRKYNVSRRENAFEVLVNLFLCKIVDEKENPQNLKFYWKGIAYDNYFDLVDRLQELYQIGMERFLQQKIVYISNKEIDEAFWAMKQKRNATKDEIKKIFRELKFFKGLDFEFIKVHNKENFEKNAKILLEIIQMWQGLRLMTKEQNQFLGDMFEFFLDNGIKQSEGQFFTPVPICKFIVSSLPLEESVKNKNEPLRAIDYACGAGHFLNEYALQVKPIVKRYKQTNPDEYFKEIYGIEKEDRLAKVAKVSAFMYGQDEINIIDADALASHTEIKQDSFDVLVANPPFAVEDFLMTLTEEQRESYELWSTTDIGSRNIQCFFIERAKQLLSPNGTAGIIIPSSILSNSDGTHTATREILLKYFDIISLVELGSGTFGKTGTNTVVLFIRRKAARPEPAVHYRNRSDDFFDNWEEEAKSNGGAYADGGAVKNYCKHINISYEAYQTLLLGKPSKELLETQMFAEYKKEFDASTEVANIRKKQQFKAKNPQEQQAELDKKFLEVLQKIEKDKLYYFLLASNNPTKVLIVKSPSDTKEQKAFLGYEWSGAKGSEGIRYAHGDIVDDIVTPLFDPKDRNNPSKISKLIAANFNGETASVPSGLEPFVSYASLVDILDFSRKEFNKAFSLTPKKNSTIETKWDLVKLEAIIKLQNGKSMPKNKMLDGNIPVYGGNGVLGYHNDFLIDRKTISIGRVGEYCGAVHITEEKSWISDNSMYVSDFLVDIELKYLYFMLNGLNLNQYANKAGQPNIAQPVILSKQIPLPPLDVQQSIVEECEAVESEVAAAQSAMEKAKGEISAKISAVVGEPSRLSNLVEIIGGGTPSTTKPEYWNGSIPWLSIADFNNDERWVHKSEKFITEEGLNNSSAKILNVGDIVISARGTVGALSQLAIPMAFNQSCYGLRAKSDADNGYLYYIIRHEVAQLKTNAYGMTFDTITTRTFDSIQIPLPPLETQRAIVAEIEKLEENIAAAKAVIDLAASRKNDILKKYL